MFQTYRRVQFKYVLVILGFLTLWRLKAHRAHIAVFDKSSCPWQSCSSSNRVTSSQEMTKIYDALGWYYAKNDQAGFPIPVLIGGQARSLYIHGVLDPADSDIDLGAAYGQKSLGPYFSLLRNISLHVSFNHEELEGMKGKFHKHGTCVCRFPNNMKFLCVRNIKAYLSSYYGASWWVEMPHMKNSILFGNERRRKWVQPLLKQLRLYDKNGDGKLTGEEIGNQTCSVRRSDRVQASSELSRLMSELEALEV